MGYRRVCDHSGNEGQTARRNHPGVGTMRCTDTETKAREKERERDKGKRKGERDQDRTESRQTGGKETAAKRK